MTVQYSDQIRFMGKSFSIAGINGTGLFDPTQHNMKPIGGNTSCRRGFICTYSVEQKQMLLDCLAIRMDKPNFVLFGIEPRPNESYSWLPESIYRHIQHAGQPLYDMVYEDLQHPIAYTGGFLIGRDFIHELYVNMGFHPAWKYQKIHELIFRNGELVRSTDRSELIAMIRREKIAKPLRPGPKATRSEIERWIEKCFDQEYRW
jgi:hypothetical protein